MSLRNSSIVNINLHHLKKHKAKNLPWHKQSQ
jgi:hypothetical protein